jgi:hypothetical protein
MKNFDQFHDGWLDGVLLDQKSVKLFLRTVQNESFILLARGVVAMAVDGFRPGNIIFDVLLRQGDELTLEDMTDVRELIPDPGGEEKVRKYLKQARERKLIIVEINPSYGATRRILAESAELLSRRLGDEHGAT